MAQQLQPLENLSLYMFEQVTNWRNNNAEDSGFTTFGKRLVTELTYVAIPFVGSVEAAFRALIALALKLASYCAPEKHREWILEKSAEFTANALINVFISGASIIGLGHNLYKDQVDPSEMVDIFTCGLLKG